MKIQNPNTRAILAALDGQGALTTGQVRIRSGVYAGAGGRTASAWVRGELLSLEKKGLVAKLDDLKPDCWLRTPAGTLALNDGE